MSDAIPATSASLEASIELIMPYADFYHEVTVNQPRFLHRLMSGSIENILLIIPGSSTSDDFIAPTKSPAEALDNELDFMENTEGGESRINLATADWAKMDAWADKMLEDLKLMAKMDVRRAEGGDGDVDERTKEIVEWVAPEVRFVEREAMSGSESEGAEPGEGMEVEQDQALPPKSGPESSIDLAFGQSIARGRRKTCNQKAR
ncbi:uncharacterized protein LY89DRAFT_684777 [Mollisia scopiformis]|uniref:Uncharacterized protein n=1 Tax=Mollisia scopiformis TaxID=149040 RepID=A0A194X934_MOLSC|nr:uncharacterized protein LY89DRAFT_684777 [Mollisia scopiformis]KUJ16681.1 hypothetical protein LY89DRAFT_684777 [Mollisia scopiformis]